MDRLVNLVSGFCDELMSLEQTQRAPDAIQAATILLAYAAVERERSGDQSTATELVACLHRLERMAVSATGRAHIALVKSG